jgi:prepilin-type processing-associated H-X9-DG protein
MVPAAITDHAASAVLEIAWPDGRVDRLPHAVLRAACRCAACEQQRRRGTPPVEDPAARLAGITPYGDGLNLVFADGHARGLYPWPYLRQLSNRF